MTTEKQLPRVVSAPRKRLHRAWLVAAVTMAALIAAAAFRSTTGALFEPIEREFGWTRAETSGAVTANLIIYGLVAPFAAVLMERLSVRRMVAASLVLVAAGSGLTVLMTEAWQLWVLWGGFVGVGTGAMALVFGAAVANRWFHKHRGLVMGIFSAGNACGQLLFLPVVVQLAEHPGWRFAALLVAGLALLIVPFLFWPFADRPEQVGLRPYGAPVADDTVPDAAALQAAPTRNIFATSLGILRDASKTGPFWILIFTFWVCGWTTNGLVQTHFIPAAHDHGMPATTASGMLALIGIFDVLGTIASGWLTDKVRPAILLGIYYAGRGVSLMAVHSLLGPTVEGGLWIFIVFYGLDWVATVPPTVALCREFFGVERSTVVFGWVFASHMVGAGIGAFVAGLGRDTTGSYLIAWIVAGALCFLAAAASFALLRMRPRVPAPTQ
ncbi:MFS transporter [Salinibacterium sp. ZJ450]|uniref:MFS transporter n=1 Tax=Salinibacterium sp. ZJ450 TaxID=2708338 RepID=UPI001CD6CBA9|nr:MFS transporter [Salinibacterium sp. ZJ450]